MSGVDEAIRIDRTEVSKRGCRKRNVGLLVCCRKLSWTQFSTVTWTYSGVLGNVKYYFTLTRTLLYRDLAPSLSSSSFTLPAPTRIRRQRQGATLGDYWTSSTFVPNPEYA